MTAQRKPATKKSPVKSVITDIENVAEEVVQSADKFAQRLEGKTVQDLRYLHDEALIAESDAKKVVVILRQRAANEIVSAEVKSEEAIIEAKKVWAEAIAWLQAVEKKLEGEFKDVSGVHKF